MLQCPLLLNILHTGTSVPEDPVFWVKRDFWRSVKFLLRIAQLLLPLWRRVLLLGKVWMGPGGPRLVQLGQGPGQPQPLLALCSGSHPAGPCCPQAALAARHLLSLRWQLA